MSNQRDFNTDFQLRNRLPRGWLARVAKETGLRPSRVSDIINGNAPASDEAKAMVADAIKAEFEKLKAEISQP